MSPDWRVEPSPNGTNWFVCVESEQLSVALNLLGGHHRDAVWSCLRAQLQISRKLGQDSESLAVSAKLVCAGVASAAWLRDEMMRGFPERSRLLGPMNVQAKRVLPPVALVRKNS